MGTCVSLIGFAFSFSDRAHPGAVGITAPFIHSSLNGAMLSGGLQHGSQRKYYKEFDNMINAIIIDTREPKWVQELKFGTEQQFNSLTMAI